MCDRMCVYTCNNMRSPPRLHASPSPLSQGGGIVLRSSLLGGQDLLELSEVQKSQKLTIQFSNVGQVFMLPQSGNIQQVMYYIPRDPSWEGKSKQEKKAAKRDTLILA